MPLFDPVRCPQCQTPVDLHPVNRGSDAAWLGLPKLPVGVHCPTCGIPLRVLWPEVWFAAVPTLIGVVAGLVVVLYLGLAEGIDIKPQPLALGLIAVAAVAALLRSQLCARIAKLRFVEPGETLVYPLETPLPAEPSREEIELGQVLAMQRPLGADGSGAAVDPDTPLDREPESATQLDPESAPPTRLATDPDDNPEAMEAEAEESVESPPAAASDASEVDAEATDDGPGWQCPKCHEDNPGTFGLCWKCNSLRPVPEPTTAPVSDAGASQPERHG